MAVSTVASCSKFIDLPEKATDIMDPMVCSRLTIISSRLQKASVGTASASAEHSAAS